jgi:hypothetical protein
VNVSAGITATFDVLDRLPVPRRPPGSVLVSDNGGGIRLTLYNEAGGIGTATLIPQRAITLTGEVIEAALSRLR